MLLCQCLRSINHLAKRGVCVCTFVEQSACVCACVSVCGLFFLSPSSSQSCLYLSVMVVPCCLHSASRGSAMNCSVISVNILAPLESRIFNISLTCRRRRRQGGRLCTHPHTRVVYANRLTEDERTNIHKDTPKHPQLRQDIQNDTKKF